MNDKKPLSVFLILGIGYALFVVIILILSIFAIMRVSFIDSRLNQVNNINSVKQRVAIDFRGSVHDRSIAIRDVVLYNDNANIDSVIAHIKKLEANYSDARARMKEGFESKEKGLDSQEKEILSRIDTLNTKALPLIQSIINAKQADNETKALSDLNQVRPIFESWLATINEFINLEEQKNQAITPIVQSSVSFFKVVLIIGAIISIILGVLIAFYIIRYLSKILGGEPNVASKSVKLIASGNLSHTIAYRNQFSMLGDIATMQDKLKAIVSGILESANGIFTNTQLVASASDDSQQASILQSQAAKQSASKIQEIHKGIFEISSIAKQTEENSQKTFDLSKKGQEAMTHTTTTIDGVAQMITDSSNQILQLKQQSDEVGNSASLIAEIADQTNLLALNAAIEAARAGEHGRGFAVVADEVRKLAERTSDATSQISTMIKQIQEEIQNVAESMNQAVPKAQESINLASQTSQILDEIQAQASDSFAKAKDVSISSAQQEESIKSVEQKMNEMVDTSTHTMETMTKASGVIKELNNISNKLKENIGFFKL